MAGPLLLKKLFTVPEQAKLASLGDAIELILEDGSRVHGSLTYWRPQGQRRFQDYLNSAEEFIPVREGDTIHLVNRERIVFASAD